METFGDSSFYSMSAKNFPLRDRQVVEIDADATINAAFGTLLTHNLMCAPVFDAVQNGYLGFFDVNDALSISYDIDLVKQVSSADEAQRMRTTDLRVVDVFNKANHIRNPELIAPWIAVGPLVPMREVLRVLDSRARRVPVVDPDSGKVLRIISQMDVVRRLHQLVGSRRESEWPEMLKRTPRMTGIGMKPVATISEEDEARDAFRRMVDENISCVGVVDDEGKLIGCISNKDIQVVMRGQQQAPKKMVAPMMAQASRSKGRFSIAASAMSDVDYFGMLAMRFVGEVRAETERGGGKSHVAVCVAHPDSTFKDIVEKLNVTGHHRVFLVDEDHQPVGLVSVADICHMVVSSFQEVDAAAAPAAASQKAKATPPPVPKRSG